MGQRFTSNSGGTFKQFKAEFVTYYERRTVLLRRRKDEVWEIKEKRGKRRRKREKREREKGREINLP